MFPLPSLGVLVALGLDSSILNHLLLFCFAWLKHIYYVKVVLPFSETWLLYLLFWTSIWAQSSFLFSFISALIFVGGVVLLFLTALGVRLGGPSLTHGLKAFDNFSCAVVFCGTILACAFFPARIIQKLAPNCHPPIPKVYNLYVPCTGSEGCL